MPHAMWLITVVLLSSICTGHGNRIKVGDSEFRSQPIEVQSPEVQSRRRDDATMQLSRLAMLLFAGNAQAGWQSAGRGHGSGHGLLCVRSPMVVMKQTQRKVNYVRPASNIEAGGEFFFPGLEGNKLRIFTSCVLLLCLVLNRIFGREAVQTPQIISEILGAIGASTFLYQSLKLDEYERDVKNAELKAMFAGRQNKLEVVDESMPVDLLAHARWVANSLLKVTPARAVVWVHADGSMKLRWGRFPEGTINDIIDTKPFLELLVDGSGDEPVAVQFDSKTRPPPAPLPRNTVSALLCRCGEGGGVVALACEQEEAFIGEDEERMKCCVKLLNLQS